MSLLCLGSAHGSPGVTTTTLALAGAWPEGRRCLVLEADPFGGVVAARFGLRDTPGLTSLAAVARRGLDTDLVWAHAQQLPGGLEVLVAPPSADQSQLVLRDLAAGLAEWSAGELEVDVIVDCGRISSASPVLSLLRGADVLLLTRPSADQLRPAAHVLSFLQPLADRARMVLVGDVPYGPEEVSSTLSVEVAGVVSWDPRTAEALGGGGGGRGGGGGDLRRSRLVRSAATLADALMSAPASPVAGEKDPSPVSSPVEVGGERRP